MIPLYVCPTRRSITEAQATAADLGDQKVFLIDYASAQPCTEHCPGGEPEIGVVGPALHSYLTADAVRAADATDDDLHQGQRRRSTSTKSTRAPAPPAKARITVRIAVAVRPARPIT